MSLAHRHLGLELPDGQGHVERHLLPVPRRPATRGLRRAALLRGALQHRRGEHHVLRPAARDGERSAGSKRTPPGFEFASSSIRSSRTRSVRGRPGAGHRRPTSTRSRRGIEPLAAAGKLGRCSPSFRPASRTRRKRADYLRWLLRTFARLPARGGAAPPELERRGGDVCDLLHEHGAAWAQIDEPKFRFSIRQDLMPDEPALLLHAAARPERRAVVGPRRCRRPLQLPLFGGGAAAVRGGGEHGARAGEEGSTSI